MESSKIKIVQIIADSALGGGPKHVLGILKNVDKSKFETYLICPSGYLSTEAKKIKDVEVVIFSPKSKFDLFALWKLKRILEKIRSQSDPFAPLIIHSHGSRGGLYARAAGVFGAKQVYTEHRFDSDFHLANPLNDWIQKLILKRQNKRSDLIIAVSSSVKKFLIERQMASEDRIVVIPNAIDLKSTGVKNSVKSANKAPILGSIGNLNKQKGQKYLLSAMAELKKKYPLITLEIIGEGPERINLLEQIDTLKLEHHVTLLGKKTEIEQYMKHWDVFVLPSIAETFGIVVLEAMEAGIPVVASNVGGVRDIITNRKNGVLVEAKKPEVIVEAISELIDHPAVAAKLKRGGLERVKEFDWSEIIKKIEVQYLKLFE